MFLLVAGLLALFGSANAITLGSTAQSATSPWSVSIMRVDALNDTYYWHSCNGLFLDTSAISAASERYWVLTSARCFQESQVITDYKVVFGSRHVVTDIGLSEVQERTVTRIMRHEQFDYNSDSQLYDLALVKVNSRPSLNTRVVTVGYPSRTSDTYVGKACYISGYGKTSFVDADDPIEWYDCSSLQNAATATITNTVCLEEYPALVTTMVCASTTDLDGLPSYPSPCGERDYGTPLVCNAGTSTSPNYVAVGVSVEQWAGQNCGEAPTITPTPIFTRVAPFRTWIINTVTAN